MPRWWVMHKDDAGELHTVGEPIEASDGAEALAILLHQAGEGDDGRWETCLAPEPEPDDDDR